MDKLTSTFDILKKTFHHYEERPQQLQMAREVFASLLDKKRLLIEAGTGVGKSFAYLIPAILSQEKTIVSTATIALQDQLVKKDLVFLQKTLPYDFSFAILKGKNNYLCVKREREFADTGEKYRKFKKWVSKTNTGDKDEIHFIPDFWNRVCADPNDCSGKLCPFYGDCFYYRHYRELHSVDILVVNHYLLIYDLLSEFNLLPFHNQLIIDEAHQIENVMSAVMGSTLSHSRMVWLFHRLRGLKIHVDELFGPADLFFKGINPMQNSIKASSHSIYPIPDAIIESLRNLKCLLSLDKIVSKLEALKKTTAFSESWDDSHTELFNITSPELTDRIETTITYVKSLSRDIDDFIERGDEDRVYYMAWNKGHIELKSNLVGVAEPFELLVKGYDSLVMTSATLTVRGKFDFLKERLGVTGFEEGIIGSPFNYKRQALLYLNKDLPTPDQENSEVFYQKSMDVIEGLVNASQGRALILFTSYNHLNFVSKNIVTDYPLKSQGDMPPSRLIRWFKETPNPVLLATTTFWQGIDIKGEKLSLVVIVKMPFISPGDPVYEERCRRLGERWFSHLALPSAILLLRQGFGRLIRGTDDRGVIAILDSRIVTSSYGKAVVSSLPAIDIAHSIDDVKRFFSF